MSVRSTALRLVTACRVAMPDAQVRVEHSRAPWGESSYVYVDFERLGMRQGLHAKARVSDHGIGMARYSTDPTSLYLADGARPAAWTLWLCDLVKRYEVLGGRVPCTEVTLFAPTPEDPLP